jgi:C4-dicarboxylate-specific signal transduction histidine kinase
MKVSTRLLLTGVFLVSVVTALALVLVSTTRSVRVELAKNEAASEVLRAVTGIRYLTLEYLSRREERPRIQWQLGHASLARILAQDSGIDPDILDALRQSSGTVSELFAELLRRHHGATALPAPSDVAADLDARLTAQIVVRLERMTADAVTLSERSRDGVLQAQRRASQAVVLASVLIALVVIAATYATLRNVSRPLARLHEGAALVGAGNLTVQLALTGRDEFSELAGAFNTMTDRLRTREAERTRAQHELEQVQADLAHVTRVATLGEMTASIAHEINQPLGAIANNASAGIRWLAADQLGEARRSAELVIADSHRASEIVARIRALAKKAPPHKEWVDSHVALEAAVAMTRAEARKRAVELESHLAQDLPAVLVDKVQIQQVLINLIVNALEALHGRAAPRVVRVSSERRDADTLYVAVDDTGPGLSADHAPRMFDAFYTTKQEGLGMGLAVSRSIVEAHHGRLWASASPLGGAKLQFTLPIRGREEVS